MNSVSFSLNSGGTLGHVLTVQFPPKLLLGPNPPEIEIVE